MNKSVYCPYCAGKNTAEMDMDGIAHGEIYYGLEECDECGLPFVVMVRASFDWGIGVVEWMEDSKKEPGA